MPSIHGRMPLLLLPVLLLLSLSLLLKTNLVIATTTMTHWMLRLLLMPLLPTMIVCYLSRMC